ncbi:hypothetical protein RND71_017932 [Anisodus tanguticus]|uniref:Uncharacterized protein n=1 Tax=Anisodus tanguticus TaxID=243964 RepID=A0AAE1S537_9SOLA|nr:hypothetical protein RND71_017932 [Anisodus tanguticus]
MEAYQMISKNLVNLDVLSLGYNNINGSIRDSIGRLTNLRTLGLDYSFFSGVIPSSIGNLTKLLYLYMGSNRLEGNIPPTLGNCKQLLYFLLHKNKLSGAIPQQLMYLSSLTIVNVSYNSLTCSLPVDIGNWSHLIALDFSFNNFSAIIPPTIGNCLSLGYFHMQRNSLHGTIPDIGALMDLQFLDLSLNNLSANMFPNIQRLHLAQNSFTGSIPSSLANATKMMTGTIRGTIPKDISNLVSLDLLYLGDNRITCIIPDSVGSLPNLGNLEYGMGAKLSVLGDIYSFGILTLEIFTGKRPTYTCFQESLSLHHFEKRALPKGVMELLDRTTLDCEMPGKAENGEECWANLNKEQVECLVDILEIGVACSAESPRDRLTMRQGEVPASLARLTKLRLLRLSVNSLSGEFPPPLYNFSSLELISLSFNNFSGNLRSDLGHYFPNLQRLYLGNCQFIGSIPSSLANASKLLQFDFPENNFTGNIPKGFGNLQNLLWLNVLSNHLGYGKNDDLDFVSSLTNCSSLQMLHFGDNQFGGTLPHSTTNLSSQLRRLLLGGNRIGGSIPKDISNLVNLNVLYMGYNNFTGSIPDIGRLTKTWEVSTWVTIT